MGNSYCGTCGDKKNKSWWAGCTRCYEDEKKRAEQVAEMDFKLKMAALENEVKSRENTDASIKSLTDEMKEIETALNRTDDDIAKLHNSQSKLCENLKIFEEKSKDFEKTAKNKFQALKLDELESDLSRYDKEIANAIRVTCVNQENVGKFLLLAHYLTNFTMENQLNMNNLSEALSTFGEIMERAVSNNLSIESYFETKNKSKELINLFKECDMYNMQDLICDDEADFEELLQSLVDEMKIENEKWLSMGDDEKEECGQLELPWKNEKITASLKRSLKRICLNGKESWMKEEKEKEEMNKDKLIRQSPLCCKFFERMYAAMMQAQSLLTYNEDLNEKQKKEIKMWYSNNDHFEGLTWYNDNKLEKENSNINDSVDTKGGPATTTMDEKEEKTDILCNNNNNNNNNNNDDFLQTTLNELEVESVTNDKIEIKKLRDSTVVLTKAVIKQIHVIDSLSKEISQVNEALSSAAGTESDTTASTVSLIKHIQASCINIINTYSQIRGAVLYANEIRKLRPAKIEDNEGKKLWDAVNVGIVNILDNATLLSKDSGKYFSYFLKFQSAFEHFLLAKDKSLMVSTEYLKKDVRSFIEFSKTFEKECKILSQSAKQCIDSCIVNGIGYSHYETAQQKQEECRENYLKAQQDYNEFLKQEESKYIENSKNIIQAQTQIETNKKLLLLLNERKERQLSMQKQVCSMKEKLFESKLKSSSKQGIDTENVSKSKEMNANNNDSKWIQYALGSTNNDKMYNVKKI